MNKSLVKISILSISLLTVMSSAAISPALAEIAKAFKGTDPTLIKLVLTLPSLLIIPFSLIGGWLATRMKKKTVLLLGLVIYFLGGVGGGFAKSIVQLLIIRGIFGIGVGLIIPLSMSLIADYFQQEERAKLTGLSGSVSHFGGVLFLLLSGWLACLNWRYAFAVYGLSLFIIFIIIFWLPEQESKGTTGIAKSKLPFNVFVCSLISIMFDYFANIPDFHSLMKHRSQLHPEQLSAESGFQCVKRSLKPFVSVPTLLGNFGGVWLASIGFASSSRITKMWAPALGVMISAWFSSLTSNKLSEELNQMNILESAAKAAACAAEHAPGQAIFLALAALCSTSKDLKKLRFYHHRNVNISILAEYIKTEPGAFMDNIKD